MIGKIRKRWAMTMKSIKSDSRISPRLAYLRTADELGGRLGLKKWSASAHAKKDEWILQYLKEKLQQIIALHQEEKDVEASQSDAPIWVCWWTGEEKAPDLVKQCIRSIKKHAGKHPVYMITEDTYGRYITIPEHMLKKQQEGSITLAQLSDYIRVSLLSEYGGLWLDATIFCARDIPEAYFSMPLFTCKSEAVDCGYISKMQWTSFVIGGFKGQPLFRYMRRSFEEYWATEDVLIDYLLVDYLIALAKQEIPCVKNAMDAVPLNNVHRDDLQAAMNDALPAEKFDDVITQDTVLYKLSWRETYSPTTADGEKSVYAAFLERDM